MLKRLQQLIIPERKGLINAVNHNMIVGSGGVCVHPPAVNVIFETNFANDAGFTASGINFEQTAGAPEGWTGIKTNQGRFDGVAGEGEGGSVAMKITYPQTTTPLATSLYKHLTGNQNTGLDEVYIRYKLRLPNNFKAGRAATSLPYWKWGRLWQNTPTTPGWTEQRTNSYYIVWNWGDGLPIWGIRNGITMAENLNQTSTGSTGTSPRVNAQWYNGVSGDANGTHINEPGMWDAVGVGAWEFDHSSGSDTRLLLNNTSQTWHTIEWRFKLSSTDTANDGVFQVWFDGVEQVPPLNVDAPDQAIDQPMGPNSLITAAKPGFNMLTVFDNMANWSLDWGVGGVANHIWINDVVIASNRIGHDYVAGSVS